MVFQHPPIVHFPLLLERGKPLQEASPTVCLVMHPSQARDDAGRRSVHRARHICFLEGGADIASVLAIFEMLVFWWGDAERAHRRRHRHRHRHRRRRRHRHRNTYIHTYIYIHVALTEEWFTMVAIRCQVSPGTSSRGLWAQFAASMSTAIFVSLRSTTRVKARAN